MLQTKHWILEHEEDIINYFQNQILKWFELYGRQFPWRLPSCSTYELIISEVLLQRTKAENVSRFYTDFLLTFPDWATLANEGVSVIESYLKPLGLQRQRANRLYSLAKWMDMNNGKLPTNRRALEEVPLMGQYIANAVELLIYKREKPLLDVNMARVLERFFGPRKLSDIRYDPYLQSLALKVVHHPLSKEINWAILDFAALICKARSPKCLSCILRMDCQYYSKSLIGT